MLRLTDLKLPLDHSEAALTTAILKRLHIEAADLAGYTVAKRSYDARKRGAIVLIYALDIDTPREAELLRLVAAGCSNWEIGEQLVITPATVKKHLEHIYTKLDVHNRTAAVARARALHLFS